MKNTQNSNFNFEKKDSNREIKTYNNLNSSTFAFNPNSNSNTNTNTQRLTKESKYNEIREKLDKLNYKLHFDISNLQLIELLTNDIISQKIEIENFKKSCGNLKEANDRSLLNVAAFKKENIKLIKENNELIKQNIELGKNLHNSNTSKSLEIKRLQEEKSDFKFMLSNSKIKIENMAKENSLLKNKLNNLLSKIYDTNFNENNLKTLFDSENNNNNKSNIDTFINNVNKNPDSNKDITDISDLKMKIGIYVKQRNIQMSSNLDLDIGNNSLNKINENQDFLKKVLQDTFAKRQNINQEGKYINKKIIQKFI